MLHYFLNLAIQAAGGAGGSSGIQIDTGQAILAVSGLISALASGIAVIYRNQISDLRAEGQRKDQLIDRLIEKLGQLADVQERGLDVVERRNSGRSPR